MTTKRITLELPAMDNPALTREQRLLNHVRAFVEKYRITEPACVAQSDRIMEASYEFIEKCAEIAGFYEYPPDE